MVRSGFFIPVLAVSLVVLAACARAGRHAKGTEMQQTAPVGGIERGGETVVVPPLSAGADPVGAPELPRISLFSSPESSSLSPILFNGRTTIGWTSVNATTCTVSPSEWQGLSGSQSVDRLTSSTTFTLTCSNRFASVSTSMTVFVQSRPAPISRRCPLGLAIVSERCITQEECERIAPLAGIPHQWLSSGGSPTFAVNACPLAFPVFPSPTTFNTVDAACRARGGTGLVEVQSYTVAGFACTGLPLLIGQ